VLGLVEVPGEPRGCNSGGEEGRYQADNDRRLDAVSRPPQLIAAKKQPPLASQRAARRRAEPLMTITVYRSPRAFGGPSALGSGPITPREAIGLVLDFGGHLGQRGRVLPVVMRAEHQVPATVEQDPDVGLSATAVAAVHGIYRRGRT
jgi:hypothetical protein